MQHSRFTHCTINRNVHDTHNVTKLQANSKLQTVSQSECAKVMAENGVERSILTSSKQ